MKRLVVLLVAVAGVVALAGRFLPSNAASVAGSPISRQSLDSDLSAIAGSPDYTCFLSEERRISGRPPLPFLGAGTASANGGVYDARFVDNWLGSMITNRVVAHIVARNGLRVTPGDLAVARSVLSRRITTVLDSEARSLGAAAPGCGGNGTAVLGSLPAWFVAEQVRAEADQAILDARAAHAGLTPAQISSYFELHRRTFAKDCISIIVLRTRAEAQVAEAALASGVPFAREAAAASATRQTAATGGVAGCGLLAGTFLARPVSAMAVGKVSGPVAGNGVFWVVQLTGRSTQSLAAVRAAVVTAVLRAGQARAGREIARAIASSSLTVDPRYGTPAAHRVTLVQPPASPPPGALLSPSAIQPRLTAASS